MSRTAANKSQDYKRDKGEQNRPSTPLKMGQDIHQVLADKIKTGRRDGTGGKILLNIESTYHCKFIQADVKISGFAAKKNTGIDSWSGIMDAIAISQSETEDVLEVFVAEWKTISTTELSKWWKYARKFKKALYQCLVYRELLLAHLKRSTELKAEVRVGIILIPIDQNDPEQIYPGLCVDFQTMDDKGLLDKLKDFQWLPFIDESFFAPTVRLPRKLFKESHPADNVDEVYILKDDTRLKEILNGDATVADLCRVLDLPFLKVEVIKEEETKAQRDDKTSVIETAAATEDETNEEFETGNKKEKAREEQT